LLAAMKRIAKLVGLPGARASGEALSCSLFAERSRQGHFFGFDDGHLLLTGMAGVKFG
jgi:hypothetical protein